MTAARLPWLLLAGLALVAGAWLRAAGLFEQIVIDDEWHALHRLLRASMLEIVTHLDYADYSIPFTVYLRWLHDTVGVSEWGMRLPMLAAGVALIAVAPLLARPWAGAPVRAAWALLLAVSPLLIYTSRTARPYALTVLAATIAIIAFQRWVAAGHRRDGWAATYVAATLAGGWLHMASLAFILMPFVHYGVVALRCDRASLRPLLGLGGVTAAALLLALLPPVVNDWFMFTAKAGVDSVTPESAYRTLLMHAGSAHLGVMLALAACASVGVVRIWRRDRGLAGYLLVVIGGGTLAIIAARPNWVFHPPVFARYLAPALPLVLLFAAEGIAALTMVRRPVLHAGALAILALVLWRLGPLPDLPAPPYQFTGHLRHQFDYDPAHNPYVQLAPLAPAPKFYRTLAQLPPGSKTLIVAPWRLESHFNPHASYQQLHRQRLLIGLVTPLCGTWKFGEYPESAAGMKLANIAHLTALLRGADYGADYLVLHRRPWSTPPGERVDWPDVDACLPAIERALGPPIDRDDEIVVFALRRQNPATPASR